MLENSWSTKLSQQPRTATIGRLSAPSIAYQGNSNQLRIHTNNNCIPFPLRKEIIALLSLPNHTLLCLTRYQLLCLDLETNNQSFKLQFQNAHSLSASPNSIFVHCGGDLFAYTHTGEEQYVVHFAALINAVTECSGSKEIVVGLNDFSLLRCNGVNIVMDYGKVICEPCSAVQVGAGVMVGTKEGTVAYYETKKAKWKAKSNHPVLRVMSYSTQGTTFAFVVRVEGQVQIKNWKGKGETTHKIKLGEQVITAEFCDYRDKGVNQFICVLASGTVKAYNVIESPKVEEQAAIAEEVKVESDNINQLLRQKAQLQHQIKQLNEIISTANLQIPQSNAQLNCNALLQHDSNGLSLIINVEGGYSSGILFQESIQPYFTQRTKSLRYLFQNQGIKGGQITAYALLHNTFTSKKCIVKILKINLPSFWKWTLLKVKSTQPINGYIRFSGSQRNARYLKWVNQCFFLNITAGEISEFERMKVMQMRMHNYYTGQQLEMVFSGSQNKVQLRCECLSTLGALFQDLMEYVGIKDLDSQLSFPTERDKLKVHLDTIEKLSVAKASISTEMANVVEDIKFLLVKGESARVVANMKEFRKSHGEVMALNRSLLLEVEKKQANTKQLSEALKALGLLINLTANVRYGKPKQIVVARCREAIQKKEFPKIISIMERGAASTL